MGRTIFVDKKSIKSFIKKVTGYNIAFKFLSFEWDAADAPIQFYMRVSFEDNVPVIGINKNCKNYNNKVKIKSGLLHEIGHIKTGCNIKSKAMREYLAQIWAIETAKYFKISKVKDRLEKELMVWNSYGWNKQKHYRRYILASKIYKNKINK